jgi:hypothetical protein
MGVSEYFIRDVFAESYNRLEIEEKDGQLRLWTLTSLATLPEKHSFAEKLHEKLK